LGIGWAIVVPEKQKSLFSAKCSTRKRHNESLTQLTILRPMLPWLK
jgi:hypothetical protein